MQKRFFLFVTIGSILCTSGLDARIIQVPSSSVPTIRAGILAAEDGDTVLVAPGMYHEHGISFFGKAITVTSTDPEDSLVVASTIVNAGSQGRCFLFQGDEGPESILTGLSITNGETALDGGGIYCNSSPTIRGNIFIRNSAENGGAICIEGGSPNLIGNLVSENEASKDGGGICITAGSPNLITNTILNNAALENGGGIVIQELATPTLKNNAISGNTAGIGGGGIRFVTSGGTIISNLIVENTAKFHGGGLSLNGSSPEITNNTIAANRVTDNPDGGGIYCYFSAPAVTNSILWYNSPDQIFGDDLTVTYSDVEGGWPGEGNLNEDPRFYSPGTGDYALNPFSPCIDAGDPIISDGCRPPGMGESISDMGAFGGEENCEWEGGDQDVTILMYPTSSTTVPRGSFLEFRVIIENHRENTVEGDLWFTIMYPDSTEYLIPNSFLNYSNPFHGQIFPHNSVDLDNTLYVPQSAILGTYRIIGRIGIYPNIVLDEDSIGFRVV